MEWKKWQEAQTPGQKQKSEGEKEEEKQENSVKAKYLFECCPTPTNRLNKILIENGEDIKFFHKIRELYAFEFERTLLRE